MKSKKSPPGRKRHRDLVGTRLMRKASVGGEISSGEEKSLNDIIMLGGCLSETLQKSGKGGGEVRGEVGYVPCFKGGGKKRMLLARFWSLSLLYLGVIFLRIWERKKL